MTLTMFRRLFAYPAPLWKPYSFLAVLFLCFGTVVMGIPLCLWIIASNPSATAVSNYLRWWLRISLLWPLQIRWEVQGAENDVSQEACLLVCNHQSHFDIPLTFMGIKGNPRMLAKKELFRIPVFGWCLKKTGMIKLDRKNRNSAHAATEAMARAFRQRLAVWVAPEGTRSADGSVGVFKKGSFSIAIRERTPVLPLVMLNTREILPKDSFLPKPGMTMRLRILPAIQPMGDEDSVAFADNVRDAIVRTLGKT